MASQSLPCLVAEGVNTIGDPMGASILCRRINMYTAHVLWCCMQLKIISKMGGALDALGSSYSWHAHHLLLGRPRYPNHRYAALGFCALNGQ